MRKFIKSYIEKVIYMLLAIAFIVSNLISYQINKKAQSDLAKNTLSFLLYQDIDDDFIEDMNENNDQLKIVSVDKDEKKINDHHKAEKDIYITDSDTSLYSESTNFKSFFTLGKSYRIKNDDTLIIVNGYIPMINWVLFLIFLLLTITSKLVLDRITNDKLDYYIKGLYYSSLKEIKDNIDYEELFPVLASYEKKLNESSEEVDSLKARLSEITSITANMKEGFILFDGEGSIELLNNSAKRFLDINHEANISNLIESREYSLALREASILKRSKKIDLNINGYDLRIFIDPLSTSSKKAYAMIIIDNTEERKAEKMRREFSANVTHELKSPLTSINGYAELIATGIAKEDDVNRFAEIICEEGNRLLEIIDDILKISSLDEKNFEKDFVDVDIYEVVRFTIEKYKRIASKKSINVTNNIKSYRIKTSKSLFYDLVSNIYENAIKYNKKHGSIDVDFDLRDNNYYLIISDTGIGISKADSERIFERFYVVDKSRKRNQKSTGLGLSIVKHIANYLGYSIKVESKLNEGTRFIIEIPLELDR